MVLQTSRSAHEVPGVGDYRPRGYLFFEEELAKIWPAPKNRKLKTPKGEGDGRRIDARADSRERDEAPN